MNFKDALKPQFVQNLVEKTVGNDYEIIERPAAYALRARQESARDLHRLIMLPPRGYTANTINQTNSHDEVESATIRINGAIREGKSGFSKTKNTLLFAAFPTKDGVSDLPQPYLIYDLDKSKNPDLITELHSAGEPPFHVVKPDGYGHYHNLINVSDDWIMLSLRKTLRPMRPADLAQHLVTLPEGHAHTLSRFYAGILAHGDAVYKKMPELVRDVEKIPAPLALPALCEMLYAHETGRHEACAAFAMILKHGKKEPDLTLATIAEKMDTQSIPAYYGMQLIQKINTSNRLDAVRNEPSIGS